MTYEVRTQTGEVRRVQISRQPLAESRSFLGFLKRFKLPTSAELDDIYQRRSVNRDFV